MLQIKNLSKVYANVAVLDDVNLTLNQSRVCLLGPNGSGKSTLLCIIAGLIDYEQGSVILSENGPSSASKDLRMHIALASDAVVFPGYLSAKTILELTQAIWCCDWPTAYIDSLGLTPHLEKRVDALSAGNLKKLQIINALMRHPEILLLDEPNIALDEGSVTAMWTLMDKFDGVIIAASNEPELFETRAYQQVLIAPTF